MTFLIPVASIGRVIPTYRDSAGSTNVAGSISANVSYGPASPNRRIAVFAYGFFSYSGSGQARLNNLNIEGTVGDIDILYNNESIDTFARVTTFAVARVPEGVNGVVSISYNYPGSLGLSTRRFIVYSIDGISSNFPVAVTDRNATISIPAGGACVGGAANNNGTNTVWTGLNKDLQASQISSASIQAEAELAGLSVSAIPAHYGVLTIWAAG